MQIKKSFLKKLTIKRFLKAFKHPINFIWFVFLSLLLAYSLHFYVNLNYTALSQNVADWAHFSGFIGSILSPIIAAYVLYYVVASFKLQKKELKKLKKHYSKQLTVDSLMCRQESVMREARNMVDLIKQKINAFPEDKNYHRVIKFDPIFDANGDEVAPKIDVDYFLQYVIDEYRSTFNKDFKLESMPSDFSYLTDLIFVIDALCTDVTLIDHALQDLEYQSFDNKLSRAFITSISAEILPTVKKLKIILNYTEGHMSGKKVNFHRLNNF